MARNVTDPPKVRIKAPARIILAVCSFLMLFDVLWLWWPGFLCAVIALFSSIPLLRSEQKKERIASIIAVILTIAGAAAYLITELGSGVNKWIN